jgi:hypothetical protein
MVRPASAASIASEAGSGVVSTATRKGAVTTSPHAPGGHSVPCVQPATAAKGASGATGTAVKLISGDGGPAALASARTTYTPPPGGGGADADATTATSMTSADGSARCAYHRCSTVTGPAAVVHDVAAPAAQPARGATTERRK